MFPQLDSIRQIGAELETSVFHVFCERLLAFGVSNSLLKEKRKWKRWRSIIGRTLCRADWWIELQEEHRLTISLNVRLASCDSNCVPIVSLWTPFSFIRTLLWAEFYENDLLSTIFVLKQHKMVWQTQFCSYAEVFRPVFGQTKCRTSFWLLFPVRWKCFKNKQIKV